MNSVGSATGSVATAASWSWDDVHWDGVVMIVGIIVVAIALRWLVIRAIGRAVRLMEDRATQRPESISRTERVFRQATGLDEQRRRQRAATMGSLLRSVATIAIFTIAALTVMARLGVPLAPLLASAGVGGVALGFGAQSLVKDFLSGIFMIIEDQYGVGDVIDTGEAIGEVEEVTLRVTRVRDGNGVVWYIRNGEIVRVGNRSQGWSTQTVNIPIAYDENVESALHVLRNVASSLAADSPWNDKLLEPPNVTGVESVTGGSVTLGVIVKCLPGEQYAVSREFRERAKVALDKAGIRGPAVTPYTPPSSS